LRYTEILEACWKGYRQAGMKQKGDRMVPNCVPVSEQQMEEDLKKWFKEKWVRFGPDGKIRGACARGDSSEGKPKCLPQAKAHALGKKGRASAAAKKRREDPNPERRGAAKNVATKVRETTAMQDPNFAAGMAAKKAGGGATDIMLAQPDIAKNQQYLDRIAAAYGLPAGLSAEQIKAKYQMASQQRAIDDIAKKQGLPTGMTKDQLMQAWRKKVQAQTQAMAEATGDQKFDTMMGRIVDPVAALSQDRVYEEQLEDYVFAFMNEFLGRMDKLGIEVWLDDARAGEDLTNPKFLQAYEQASSKAVQRFMQGKKLDVNNQRLVAKVKADFDENADQVNPVAGFLGAFMQGFTVLRPGEIDVLNKAGMLKKPGEVDEAMTDYQKRRQRERDVDMGKPVRPLPRNPQTDWAKKRAKEKQEIDEKQDACYQKVKSRYKVWPSAYASGALVQCRKKGAANWGNKTKKE